MLLPPVITDTNVLLQVSAEAARGIEHGTFKAIKRRGFITKSVDIETTVRSRTLARSRFNLDPDAMHRAWMRDIRPQFRVVDITDAELDHEAIEAVRSRDADQADLDTAALAVLLSPCMVITEDDDLRAVARPHLAPDVLRSVRHAEPSHHAVARERAPLVARHTLLQGGVVGALATADMARSATVALWRTAPGRLVLALGAGAVVWASTNPTIRTHVGTAIREINDLAAKATIDAIAAEQACAARMFPEVEPQSTAHQIAQHVTHDPFWSDPEKIAATLDIDVDAARAACRGKWFSVGVFGSIKVGVSHEAPQEVEGEELPVSQHEPSTRGSGA